MSRRILEMEPHFPDYLSPVMQDFILRLLVKDPAKRLGARGVREIKDHGVFTVRLFFFYVSYEGSGIKVM